MLTLRPDIIQFFNADFPRSSGSLPQYGLGDVLQQLASASGNPFSYGSVISEDSSGNAILASKPTVSSTLNFNILTDTANQFGFQRNVLSNGGGGGPKGPSPFVWIGNTNVTTFYSGGLSKPLFSVLQNINNNAGMTIENANTGTNASTYFAMLESMTGTGMFILNVNHNTVNSNFPGGGTYLAQYNFASAGNTHNGLSIMSLNATLTTPGIKFYAGTGVGTTGLKMTISPTQISVTNVSLDMGSQLIRSVQDPALAQDAATKHYADTYFPWVYSGSGAPLSTPAKIGNLYVDVSAPALYFAKGTSGPSDWALANS